MERDTKIFLVLAVLVITAWLFDLSSWLRANIELVTAVMVGSVIGAVWWIADKLKEIEKLVRDLFDKE